MANPNPDPYPGSPGDEPGSSLPPAPPPPANYPPPSYPPPTSGAPGMPPYAVAQPGGLADRFVARFLDGIIVGVADLIISLVLGSISSSWFITGFIYAVVGAALNLGYFAYFESSRGQTLGKQVMKLKVFGPDHVSNPTLEQAVRRNIWTAFGILGIVPFVGSLLGGLLALGAVILIVVNINSDPQRQHWFDKFAGGTQVLKIG